MSSLTERDSDVDAIRSAPRLATRAGEAAAVSREARTQSDHFDPNDSEAPCSVLGVWRWLCATAREEQRLPGAASPACLPL